MHLKPKVKECLQVQSLNGFVSRSRKYSLYFDYKCNHITRSILFIVVLMPHTFLYNTFWHLINNLFRSQNIYFYFHSHYSQINFSK